LTNVDQSLLDQVEKGFETVGKEIEAVHLRSALGEAIRLASEVNKYLDQTAPWFTIKQDKTASGRSIYVAMRAIDSLKTLFSPFLPFTSARLHAFMGYTDELFGTQTTQTENDNLGEHTILRYDPAQAAGKWQFSQLIPGQVLRPPEPLFRKLEEKVVAEERARLGDKPV
jgi:methionyl-tRNA synthetase